MNRILRSSVAVGVVAACLAVPAQAQVPQVGPAHHALGWLSTQVGPDGSVAGSAGTTEDVVFGAVSSGVDPSTLGSGSANPVAYLSSNQAGIATDVASAGKLALALRAARLSDAAVVTQVTSGDPVSTIDYAFGILALSAAGKTVFAGWVSTLRSIQITTGADAGSWAYCGDTTSGACAGTGGDSNSTALAIQALRAAGALPNDSAINSAITYLHADQARFSSGGFGYDLNPWTTASDANSDAYVLEALTSAGQDACGTAWQVSGHSAVQDLETLQNGDGSVAYQSGDGALLDTTYATVQAPQGLSGLSLPLQPTWAPGATAAAKAVPALPCA
ncbi:MAG: prenyltransferase/squalene oxidase repeat-containing protein [Candidatus Dormibacteria bacterium]